MRINRVVHNAVLAVVCLMTVTFMWGCGLESGKTDETLPESSPISLINNTSNATVEIFERGIYSGIALAPQQIVPLHPKTHPSWKKTQYQFRLKSPTTSKILDASVYGNNNNGGEYYWFPVTIKIDQIGPEQFVLSKDSDK